MNKESDRGASDHRDRPEDHKRNYIHLGECISIGLTVVVAIYELVMRFVLHKDIEALGALFIVILAFLALSFFAYDFHLGRKEAEKRAEIDRRARAEAEKALSDERVAHKLEMVELRSKADLEMLQLQTASEREIARLAELVNYNGKAMAQLVQLASSVNKLIGNYRTEMHEQAAIWLTAKDVTGNRAKALSPVVKDNLLSQSTDESE